MRRAAAAAVSATLSAAVVTIVIDGQQAALEAAGKPSVPLPPRSPSAMASFMPVSVERPTGARPTSTHAVPAQRTPDQTVEARAIKRRAIEGRTVTTRAGAERVDYPTGARIDPARRNLSIGRGWAAAEGATVQRHRPAPGSIGDLHLSESSSRRVR